MILTRNIGNVHELLGPELGHLDLLRHVHLGLLTWMSLLWAINNGQSEPLGVHGGDKTKEKLLLRFSVAITIPGVGNVSDEFRQVLDLIPHLDDGELRPLRYLHGGDLEWPEDVFGACEDLVKKVNRAVLLFWEEDVLNRNRWDYFVESYLPLCAP